MAIQLDNCIFSKYQSEILRGALAGLNGSPRITNCLFINNTVGKGGASPRPLPVTSLVVAPETYWHIK